MSEIYAEYTGDKTYLQGLPARDMTREEWEAIEKPLQDQAVKLGLVRLNDRKAERTSKPAAENKE